MIRIANTLIDPKKITYAYEDEKRQGTIVVAFDNGLMLEFKGIEAMEFWKAVDPSDDDWRKDD